MMIQIPNLEGKGIGAEPVITDNREVSRGPGGIRDGKPPADPLVDVLLYGKGRLAEDCHARNLRA